MTNSEQHIELARRLVACPGFRWLPGMRTAAGTVIDAHEGDDGEIDLIVAWWVSENADIVWWTNRGELPDLRDPATLGCVLQLVRDAWGSATAQAVFDGEVWWVHYDATHAIVYGEHDDIPNGDTEIEALVAALEAAPPR